MDFIPLESKIKKTFFEKKNVEKNKPKRARIIVRNISYKTKDEQFKNFFSPYGNIVDINLVRRPDSKLTGFGFVQYEKVNEAAKAIMKCNNIQFLNRPIIVDWALGKDAYEKRKKGSNKIVKTEETEENVIDIKEEREEENQDIKEEQSLDENSDSEEIDDESEDEQSDDSDDEQSDASDEKKNVQKISNAETKKKVKSNDVKDGCTVFLKNVPFEATSDDIKKLCIQYGPISYAVICVDSLSGHSKGTAFVKFRTRESADMCLNAGEEFILMDQVVQVLPALSREILNEKKKGKDENKDSRNLYLVKEGLIMAGSKAAEGVSASDMAKRHKLEQLKGQVLKNLNRFVSRNRLSIHNLPLDYDDSKLKSMIIKKTKFHPHECRVMRENKPSMGHPLGKSRGFGFMSFKTHAEALSALRMLNNNPSIFGRQNRPIVSFSIEDRSVHNIKKKRLIKSQLNNPLFQQKKKENKNDDRKIDTKKNYKPKMRHHSLHSNEEESDFKGTIAKMGSFLKMRSNKKIREQSQTHKKNVSEMKRKRKNMIERKNLRAEKKSIDRTKKGRKNKDKDNFTPLVEKYKKMVEKSGPSNKTKRTKWYNS